MNTNETKLTELEIKMRAHLWRDAASLLGSLPVSEALELAHSIGLEDGEENQRIYEANESYGGPEF